jgi:8-oxo-dGTP pyrophosphatase MutT (NUDIX family)
MRTVVSAGVLIQSGDKYLLCHATGHGADKGWGLPKGRVDAGESDRQAAVRETQEECGLDIPEDRIEPLTQVKYRSWDGEDKVMKLLKIFIYRGDASLQKQKLVCSTYFNPSKENPNIKLPEVDGFKWLTAEEAQRQGMKSIKSIFDLL